MSYFIFQDWISNKQNIKGRLILIAFRIAHFATYNKLCFIILVPYLILYRVSVEWILGCELPYKTKIGNSLKLYHGQAVVINDGVQIGANCCIRQSTTIGNKQYSDGTFSKSPILGHNVNIGSNVCIIGPITVGDNVIIGAGSVVVKDILSNSIVAGNPARLIRYINLQKS